MHRFFIQPCYWQGSDTDCVFALGLGVRHYCFKTIFAPFYLPGKEYGHHGLGRIWERPFLVQKYSLVNLARIELSKKTFEC